MTRSTALLAALACLAVNGCGDSGSAMLPAPQVTLTSAEKEVWAKLPPDRSAIPVLVYHGIGPESDFSNAEDAAYGIDVEDFATQMTEIRHAGYQTVRLQTFLDFVSGEPVDLPPRPLLLTFDDGRADSWTGADGILRELHFNAVMFVDVGRVVQPRVPHLGRAPDGAGQRPLAVAAPLRRGSHHDPLRPGSRRYGARTTPMRRGTRTSTPGGNGCGLISSGARRPSPSTYRHTATRLLAAIRQLRPGRHERRADPGRPPGLADRAIPGGLHTG